MHPAISVIFFTVSSGAGFGFMAMLGLGVAMPDDPISVFLISMLAGGLAVAGLLSSTFHLGHPERAWRAFSQWRSSWLSREGIAAVVTLILFGFYALSWIIVGERIGWLGGLIALGSVITVFTTSMIYAQLKTIPHWHSALTPVCYLLFSAASGVLLMATSGIGETMLGYDGALLSIGVITIAWLVKIIWWKRAKATTLAASGSTVETATGLGFIGKVRLFERPHSGENYLTTEMVHKIGRKHAEKLRMLSLIFGALLPIVLCLVAYGDVMDKVMLLLAFISLMAGLFIERWLYFAEAEHAVSLYYRH